MAQRQKRPGEAGLANESRPGLGSRRDRQRQPGKEPAPKRNAAKQQRPARPQKSGPPRGPVPPLNRPEPVEQDPASLEHEYERDTGMSGKSAGV